MKGISWEEEIDLVGGVGHGGAIRGVVPQAGEFLLGGRLVGDGPDHG